MLPPTSRASPSLRPASASPRRGDCGEEVICYARPVLGACPISVRRSRAIRPPSRLATSCLNVSAWAAGRLERARDRPSGVTNMTRRASPNVMHDNAAWPKMASPCDSPRPSPQKPTVSARPPLLSYNRLSSVSPLTSLASLLPPALLGRRRLARALQRVLDRLRPERQSPRRLDERRRGCRVRPRDVEHI